MNSNIQKLSTAFVQDIKIIIGQARKHAVRSVEFYRTFPIASALRTQFNWSQYKMLLSIEDRSKGI